MFSVEQLSIVAGDTRQNTRQNAGQINAPVKVLVKDLSFTVLAGQRWAVLGANGCGKSSLLHACAGLPTAGRSVQFEALTFGEQGVEQRFEQHAATPAQLAPLRSVCPQKLGWNTALSPLQLSDLLGVRMYSLDLPALWLRQPLAMRSGGEQQRIAIALTLAQAPALCFLDEPLTHLDEVQQMQLLNQLRTISQTTGKALLMVSHHLRLSLAWATHVLLPAGDGRGDGDSDGAWLSGPVGTVCNPENIAAAYGIDAAQAQQLLSGQALFNAL